MKKSSLFASILNLTNSVTGAAFLALPFQITFIGQVGIGLFLVLFFVLNYCSLQMLAFVFSRSCDHKEQANEHRQGEENVKEIKIDSPRIRNHSSDLKRKLFRMLKLKKEKEGLLVEHKTESEEHQPANPPSSIYGVKELHNLLDEYSNTGVVTVYHISVILSMFGSLCVLIIVARTCILSLVLTYLPETPLPINTIFICCFTVLVFLPTLVKKISSQWVFSFISLISLLYIFVAVLVRGSQTIEQTGFPPYIQPPFTFNALSCMGVIAFSFTCQMNAIPIYDELENPTEWRLGVLNFVSLLLSSVFYLLIALFGFYSQGTLTNSNIILGFPIGDTVMQAAKVFLIMKMFFTFPLFAHPLLASFDDIIIRVFSVTQDKAAAYWARRIASAAFFVIGAALVGFFFDDISPVISLTGAIADSFISFLFPSLLMMYWIVNRPGEKETIMEVITYDMVERYQGASSLALTSIVISGLTIFGLLSNFIS